MKSTVILVGAVGLAACATMPVPQAASLEQGLLVARVEAHGAVFRKHFKTADLAGLVALDEHGIEMPGQVGRAGLEANGYVVFLGLPAGRYALRDASFKARGARYELTSPRDSEAKRAVVLRPGTAAYLGDHGFDSRFPEFDVAVERTLHIVFHWLTPFLKRPLITRDSDMRGFENDSAHEIQGLLAVRDALAGSQWRRLVDARLHELSAPEPAKTQGALRAREIPLREEPFLSWRDTLKWGEPRRAPEGIAWKRPGGEAQIAVFFTTASTPGFAGWEAAVSELRHSAAGSVEDSGGVYEVRVATRAGLASRATKYRYAQGTLVGSETSVVVTETTLVPDGCGLFTARLRAPRAEFDAALPAYREFLLQLVLGPPKPKQGPKPEAVLPFIGGAQ